MRRNDPGAVEVIALFGGSGATWRQVIRRAVERGLRVRALVRRASGLDVPPDAGGIPERLAVFGARGRG